MNESMKQIRGRRVLALALTLLLCLALLPAAALADDTSANQISLADTQGTVTVRDAAGNIKTVRAGMHLYSGYTVTTAWKSYAWLMLDKTKSIKLDAYTSVEVRRNGTKLEVFVTYGKLFFSAETLQPDETLNIRTSTMVCGIRGTDGILEVVDHYRTRLKMLTGQTLCTVTDPLSAQRCTARVGPGREALFWVADPSQQDNARRAGIVLDAVRVEELEGFALTEIVRLPGKTREIADATLGAVDLTGLTAEQAQRKQALDEAAAAEKAEAAEKAVAAWRDANDAGTVLPVWRKDETPPQESGAVRVVSEAELMIPGPVMHSVRFATDGGSAVRSQYVEHGEPAVQPDDPTREGYTFAQWTLDGAAFDFSTPITADTTLTAQWTPNAPETFAVTVDTKIAGGAVTADKTEAAAGDTVTLTATPDAGYAFGAWTVTDADGGAVTVENSSFTMPAKAVTVSATFTAVAPTTYAVNVPPKLAGGAVTADKTEAAAGETVTLTVTPDDGFHTTEVTVTDADGGNVPVENSAFTMPAKAVTVTATFAQD